MECNVDDEDYVLHAIQLKRQNEHKKHSLWKWKYLCSNLCNMCFLTHKQRWTHHQTCDYGEWIAPVAQDRNTQLITVNNTVVKVNIIGISLFYIFVNCLHTYINTADNEENESKSDHETELQLFQNFHLSDETYSQWDKRRKASSLETDKDLFIRCPKNYKTVWGIGWTDIQQFLPVPIKERYPWNWIGLQLKENGKLTDFFLKNHYF